MQSPAVVVIEDNDYVRRSMTRSLEAAGLTVQGVRDGLSGLARIRAEKPDLVLLDVSLGELSGIDVLKAIRADDPALPVILVTGQVDLSAMERDAQLRYDDLIAKPFYPQELVHRVQRILKRRSR